MSGPNTKNNPCHADSYLTYQTQFILNDVKTTGTSTPLRLLIQVNNDMQYFPAEALFFVEVSPIWFAPTTDVSHHQYNEGQPVVSAAFVKQLLREKLSPFPSYSSDDDCLAATKWISSKTGSCNHVYSSSISQKRNPSWVRLGESNLVVPVVYIPSEDPTMLETIPCWIVGYSQNESAHVTVLDSTLVRILPVIREICQAEGSRKRSNRSNAEGLLQMWRDRLTGELPETKMMELSKDQLFACHNPKTIEELTLRVSRLISMTTIIGTTSDAFAWNRKKRSRRLLLQRNIPHEKSLSEAEPQLGIPFPPEVSLTFHSPHHGAGKTLLVKAIAQELGATVHVIQPGAIMAKYGIHADIALESILHGVIISAAVRNVPICIVIDHFDAMLPSSFSGRTAVGDAALPVLNAIAGLLKTVAMSVQSNGEYPFPSKNPLYNLEGSRGICINANLCIIGIVTCQDVRKQRETEISQNSVLSAMAGGRYRLPDLLASSRLAAFRAAFEYEGLVLANSAEMRLSVFATSTIAIRGAAFGLIAKQLRLVTAKKADYRLVETDDLGNALERFLGGPSDSGISVVANEVRLPDEDNQSELDMFSSVGGNNDAKLALEEALAMDPFKRTLLYRMGSLPPAGVLLYGPPGTGKTMLAKAVSKLLRSSSGGAIGGAFLSLQASDIVESEIGTSEKKLVAAFETARINAPSVIFIDEFQALFTERRGSGSGKLASTLLQCLDDINRWAAVDLEVGNTTESVNYERNRVVVLGATNTPWMIDKAFLRAGRFDRTVYVGLPSQMDRACILAVNAKKMRIQLADGDRDKMISTLCSNLAAKTEGFSGADLAALCRAAAVRSLRDSDHESSGVTLSCFLAAVGEDVSPSSSPALVEKLRLWRP